MRKYKVGDIVRRTDYFYNGAGNKPYKIDHFLVLSLGDNYNFLGQEYKVFHIEENDILDLFLKSSHTMKYRKVA